MADTKGSIDQILRLAETRANAKTSGALQRRDHELANLSAGMTAAGRAVRRFPIWERYLSTWASAFVRAYAKSAGQFGAPDAFARQQLGSLRSAVRSHTQIGIDGLEQSVDTDYATTADGSRRPLAARYASLLAKVMAAADIEIAALAAEGEVQLLTPDETTPDADHNRVAASDPALGAQEQLRPGKRQPMRRNARYEAIDIALRAISAAAPKNHNEVFRFLDDRKVAIPNREPFKGAGGWLKGFQQDRPAARVWLSQVWKRLDLPQFAPGPKK